MQRLARIFAVSALAVAWILLVVHAAHAGGPLYVAGVSYFDPAVKGVPLTWAQGTVLYSTDLGDLSPLLPQASANALVADAFSRWTNIATVAIMATPAGSLAEDVNGSNITNPDGTINLPADIQPGAAGNPVGIVYDFDGQVTETLLGKGSSSDCVNNAVYGGLDAFTTTGNFAHALVILNGLCAQDPALLPDFEYRLVRVLGRVFGLAPSQANLNVWTGNPPPGAADQAGFPAKHAMDPSFCLPITKCLTGADQPKMDDRAALGRLYPVTQQNQGNYQGKLLFSGSTARIHGVVHFPDSAVLTGQGMQGVNIVARWIDPITLQPSRTYVATTVSGFLYRGNAGNPVTGFADATGTPFDRWGSDDASLQGFFDLAGLELPDGNYFTTYQITVEPVDPLLSVAVGPYAPLQVNPSGTWAPVVVPVSLASDVAQDIAMVGAAISANNVFDSQDYFNPSPVLGGGEWGSSFDVASGTNYYRMSAQANRTFSVEVEALDESGNLTENKAQPVIGIWALTDPIGTVPPAATPSPFNAAYFGETRLDAQVLQATDFRIGITDWRGDGRPDYAHRVRVLYGDSVSPVRVGVGGGEALRVQGLGFRPGMAAKVGGLIAPIVALSTNQIVLLTPVLPDGVQTVFVRDPATGGSSILTHSITTGASATDILLLLPVPNPAIPVGGTTPNALQFLVVQADGVTTVAGATVSLSTTNSLTLDICGGASSCSVASDASGRVVTNAMVNAVGPGLVTAVLAPASYPNPSTVVTTLTGTATTLDIAVVKQFVEVEQGTTLSVPLLARVLNDGIGLPGQTVRFQVAVGQGSLGAASVASDKNGDAPNALLLTRVAADVQVTACVAPLNSPCKTFSVGTVPVAALRIEPVSGTQQVTTEGKSPQLVTVRVTDGASPPNPVFGANVTFQNVLGRGGPSGRTIVVDDQVVQLPSDLVLLGSTQAVLTSDFNFGHAQIAPWASAVSAGQRVAGFATADSGAQVAFSLLVLERTVGGGSPMRSADSVVDASAFVDLSRAQNMGGFLFYEDALAAPTWASPVPDEAVDSKVNSASGEMDIHGEPGSAQGGAEDKETAAATPPESSAKQEECPPCALVETGSCDLIEQAPSQHAHGPDVALPVRRTISSPSHRSTDPPSR